MSELRLPHHPESAIHPRRIVQLFLRPKKYFHDLIHLDRSKVYLLAYLLGIFLVMDRIDSQMIKAQMMQRQGNIEFIVNSWLNYWGFVLVLGSISGLIAWHLYGWWYEVRLKWSGVKTPDSHLVKQVNVLQWLIAVIPIIALTIIQTCIYQNYDQAYNADELWSGLIVIACMVYSSIVSFIAVKTLFPVNRWSIFWFLIFPLLFYSTVIVAFAILIFSN